MYDFELILFPQNNIDNKIIFEFDLNWKLNGDDLMYRYNANDRLKLNSKEHSLYM